MARTPKPTPTKNWLPMFMEFIGNLTIDSKETGIGTLRLYDSQRLFLENVAQGLDAGIRQFVNLKARQLGISTVMLAIDLFWLFVHPGTQGALICDTDDNKEVFRDTIDRYLEALPDRWKVRKKLHNRTLLTLSNGSRLQYMVAGARGNKNLGTSRGLNFLHCTEVAKWGDETNMASLMASLAQTNPNRLYIFESTANGINAFWEMWNNAQEDSDTQKAFFIGWWANETYRIARTDPRFAKYMQDDATPDEKEKASIVYERYQWQIMPEQLAWYRWQAATRAVGEGSMEQEFPWHEMEAFVETGNAFFPAKLLTSDLKRVLAPAAPKFEGYRYMLGDQFTQTALDVMKLDPVKYSPQAELRVWHRPVPNGRYAIGFDPAYGRTDWGDSHCISVWRCYADKIVQVAEYDTPDPETYQVIWVLAHLCGIYRDCIVNVEVNGPGIAIVQGLKHLKSQLMMEAGQKGVPALPEQDRMFVEAIQAARWYLYHRPDSLGAGYQYGWKTTADNKLAIMNQLRDTYMLRNMWINSGPLLRQMETIRQDGGEIAAYGKRKDDRVFAAAFAHKAWIEWIRPSMLSAGHTWALLTEREQQAATQPAMPSDTFVGGIIRHQFESAASTRRDAAQQARFNRRF